MVLAGSDVLERQIRIAAKPETVFGFFVDPVKMQQWKGIRATLDPRPGGIYRVEISDRDVVQGKYLEVVPNERLVFTWGWEGEDSPLPPGTSTVEITFTPEEGGTLVRLRHLGLPPALVNSHVEGWEHFLPRLASAAEGHNPGPDPWSM